jgi:hypothetical protein
MDREWVMPCDAGTSSLGLIILHSFACGFVKTALPRMDNEWVMPRAAGTSSLGHFIPRSFACGFIKTALPEHRLEPFSEKPP